MPSLVARLYFRTRRNTLCDSGCRRLPFPFLEGAEDGRECTYDDELDDAVEDESGCEDPTAEDALDVRAGTEEGGLRCEDITEEPEDELDM